MKACLCKVGRCRKLKMLVSRTTDRFLSPPFLEALGHPSVSWWKSFEWGSTSAAFFDYSVDIKVWIKSFPSLLGRTQTPCHRLSGKLTSACDTTVGEKDKWLKKKILILHFKEDMIIPCIVRLHWGREDNAGEKGQIRKDFFSGRHHRT